MNNIQEFRKNKKYVCEICAIESWQEKPLTLEIDHIDGNNKNNNTSNLRYLCPNCHSQTDTWRGRNSKRKKIISDYELLDALTTTKNISQALIKVGLVPKGANYKRAAKLISPEIDHQIQKNNSQYGTCWIHNGTINRKIKNELLDEYINLGWTKGRLYVHQNSNKGKIFITNGKKNKMIEKNQKIPENWFLGKIP